MGGESLNFQSLKVKITIKLYGKNKKLMVQGTPDAQDFFIKHYKEFIFEEEVNVNPK